jgi:hypothetical protein
MMTNYSVDLKTTDRYVPRCSLLLGPGSNASRKAASAGSTSRSSRFQTNGIPALLLV